MAQGANEASKARATKPKRKGVSQAFRCVTRKERAAMRAAEGYVPPLPGRLSHGKR